ncbi:MAG: RecQ family ATP-dependent DNA helicase [Tenacibaculum sp.]|nr:RecQ family ATP-dependent DNA helicase [Tenacibaculum sp.]
MNLSTDILQKYWGFNSFVNLQEEIIKSVLEEKDTIALLPTGGGKSICFQVPAMLKNGVCIVVSPLIALIQDQVNSLLNKGIKATFIPSGTSQDEIITLFDNVKFGNFKFLYVSPERLQSKFIQNKIGELKVSLIAIDEAHCISEWGHDFRPSYRNINVLREIHPNVNFIALTASATKKVLNDINISLGLKSPNIFKKSFFRDNLAYQIHYTEDKFYKLKQLLTKNKSSAIVYVNTRKRTKEISTFLNANGFKSGFYNGGLSYIEKQTALNNWITENTPIIVATNAFGMGIDKPNVSLVIHFNLPNSIENYIQEAGRAGRDGNKALSVVLTNESDIVTTKKLQEVSFPTINEIKEIHEKLYQHFQIAKGELIEEKFDFNLLEFCNKYNFIPNKLFNAVQILHNNGVLSINYNSQKNSTIKFLVNSNQLLHYSATNLSRKKFIQSLLRMYGGVFEQEVKIDEFYLAKKTEVTSWIVIKNLEKLAEDNIIEYNKSTSNPELYFLQPREDDKTINRISKKITSYLNQKKHKTDEIINFIKEDSICRSVQILNYFDEKSVKKCGMCDVCLKTKSFVKNITEQIIELIKINKELSSRDICEKINAKEEDVLINLRLLLSEEKIKINTYNKYILPN